MNDLIANGNQSSFGFVIRKPGETGFKILQSIKSGFVIPTRMEQNK